MFFFFFTEIPESIGNLVNLRKLLLQGNCFTKLPKSFEKLTQLEEVNLGGIPWVKIKSSSVLSYDGFRFFLGGNKLDRWLEANEKVMNPIKLRMIKSHFYAKGIKRYSMSKI